MRIGFTTILLSLLLSAYSGFSNESDTVFHFSKDQLSENGLLRLPRVMEWKFQEGSNLEWAKKDHDDSTWKTLDSLSIVNLAFDSSNRFEGWFRFKIRFDTSFVNVPPFVGNTNTGATDLYIDGQLVHSFGQIKTDSLGFRRNTMRVGYVPLNNQQTYQVAIHFQDFVGPLTNSLADISVMGTYSFLYFLTYDYGQQLLQTHNDSLKSDQITYTALGLISLLFWLFYALNRQTKNLFLIACFCTTLFLSPLGSYFLDIESDAYLLNEEWPAASLFFQFFIAGLTFSLLGAVLANVFLSKVPRWLSILCWTPLFLFAPAYMLLQTRLPIVNVIVPAAVSALIVVLFLGLFITQRKKLTPAKYAVVAGLGVMVFAVAANTFILETAELQRFSYEWGNAALAISFVVYVALRFKESRLRERQKSEQLIQVTEEKKEILASQNIQLEAEVVERTKELRHTIQDLKQTQNQLIQSEKMASLGELTAGIAHEIQNPLNFVNNFSDLNKELIEELKEAVAQNDQEEVTAILTDLAENEGKINHHGRRAEEIVKSMLQHSRTGSGEKELTDINQLADEYLRLAYHGLRAKDKSFNADFKAELDPSLPKVKAIPQDIGRVLLNLINNAFQAVNTDRHSWPDQESREADGQYSPEVIVSTKKLPDAVQITVSDNGPGIPEDIRDRIFQPFFTTKVTGQGTGLGLSMSYDIITKGHGGTITVDKNALEQGATFKITLPF